jgi:antitoxin (DNA-binding transcriptional repressor) of toxin-antitoxin stability system
MNTVTLEEAQAGLAELIARLQPGEEVIIVRDNQPIAKLIAQNGPAKQPRQPGRQKDQILYMADDFDAPLDDFKEYME